MSITRDCDGLPAVERRHQSRLSTVLHFRLLEHRLDPYRYDDDAGSGHRLELNDF